MNEKLLHFIWNLQLFNHRDLSTTRGDPVIIHKTGQYNRDAGPDFFNARIRIGDTLWAGNIEIHKQTSDWFLHRHQKDPAYKNVILHVVYEDDMKEDEKRISLFPTLELKDRLPPTLLSRYEQLNNNKQWIPCGPEIAKIQTFKVNQWLSRVLVDRLENKSAYILQMLQKNRYDWKETFYQVLARTFGFRVNAETFEQLARSLPLKLIAKHKNNLLQIEALLYGQAGFLNEIFAGDYPNQLKKEYRFLQTKYGLNGLEKHQWKFLRLRPANFPTIRISQFASLLYNSSHLFSRILETGDLKKLQKLFQVKASPYWDEHYQPDKISPGKRPKKLGKKAIENTLINTVVPFLFLYGKLKDQEPLKEKAIYFLENLPPEKNRILSRWEELGIDNKHAFQSQALLQLKKFYCDYKKCLDCGIGAKILLNTGNK